MEFQPLPADLVASIATEAARLQVPGAAIGVIHDGTWYGAAFGITNINHPLPVTLDTLFQIGSTSKTFTGTALMQLVEAGEVELDAPVRRYLPDFALESEADAAALTVHHLVTHHGGFVGDYFRDTGRGEDALARIVAKMARTPQLVPAGTTFSYSNAGLYVAGHIIEVVSGKPFEQVIRERIFAPLGLDHTTYFPEETIIHRTVAGHIVTADGPVVARPWNVPRSIAPGGGVISTVRDQLAYAAFQLGDGRAPSGERLLALSSLQKMQRPQRKAGSMCDEIGITWMLFQAGGVPIVAHGGATTGHLSAFELAPSRGFACTVLTNADSGRGLRPFVTSLMRKHFLGIEPEIPRPFAGAPTDTSPYAGRYVSRLTTLDVGPGAEPGELIIQQLSPAVPGQIPPLPADPIRGVFIEPDRIAALGGDRLGETAEFLRGSDDRIVWMRWDGRIARRQD